MTALVTGAAGHLGNNVVRALLARGRKVRALVRSESGALDGLDVERVRGDILDRSSLDRACDGVEVVYHFAAVVSIDPSDAPLVTRTNAVGTRNVVEACLARRVKRLVHASSVHALSPHGGGATDETRAPNASSGATPYDRSKIASENEVGAGVARGLDAVIVSPTAVLGPHDYVPRLAGRGLLDLYHGTFPVNVDGGFDWVDARDAAAGALAAAERGRRGEKYLLSGRWASMAEIAAIMREATGRKGPRLVVPLWLARMGVTFVAAHAKLRGRRPLVTAEALRALSEHRTCSSAKARGELGYAPRPLERTIADAFAFYAEAGLLERGATRGRSLPAGAFVDPPAAG